MWKPILIILIIFAVLGFGYKYLTKPSVTDIESSALVTDSKPLQSTIVHSKDIPLVMGDLDVTLKPKARYKITAMLLSKKRYVDGWVGKLAPYDFILGWRKAAVLENVKNLPITQSVRWYQFIVSPATNMTSSYISTHTSNNHIIPATKNIRKAIQMIKVYDKVKLDGYLVNVQGTAKSGNIRWLTSTSRIDTGNTSSEIFYVTCVRIGDNVYK